MPSQPSQPTILVKKADGTSVRMTMDEFKAYRAKKPQHPSTTTPQHATVTAKPSLKEIKDSRQTSGKVVEWKDDGVKEIKEISGENSGQKRVAKNLGITELKNSAIQGTVKPDPRVEEMMKNLTIPMSEEVRARVRSLLVSRVRNIRTDTQLREYLVRGIAEGGLGFSSDTADAVMFVVRRTMGSGESRQEIKKLREIKEMNGRPKEVKKLTEIKEIVGAFPAFPASQASQKPLMHDVTMPVREKRSMGPIDELRECALLDFRRLGRNAEERAERLLAKFEGLKAESYVMFLDAKDAWMASQLYRQYQEVIVRALLQGTVVSESLGEMKEEEFEAMVKVNGMLA